MMPPVIKRFPQGSTQWNRARLGLPTASMFSRIVTPTGKPSSQQSAYIAGLLAEWALGEPMNDLSDNPWIERGKALEPQARQAYIDLVAEQQGVMPWEVDFEEVGLIYKDESQRIGCSPDCCIGANGLLEIKCPMPKWHLYYLSEGVVPKDYRPQVQAQLWISERAYVDFMSYCPDLPPLLVRVEPDEKWHAALDTIMPEFLDELETRRQKLLDMGVEPVADIKESQYG